MLQLNTCVLASLMQIAKPCYCKWKNYVLWITVSALYLLQAIAMVTQHAVMTSSAILWPLGTTRTMSRSSSTV